MRETREPQGLYLEQDAVYNLQELRAYQPPLGWTVISVTRELIEDMVPPTFFRIFLVKTPSPGDPRARNV